MRTHTRTHELVLSRIPYYRAQVQVQIVEFMFDSFSQSIRFLSSVFWFWFSCVVLNKKKTLAKLQYDEHATATQY